MGIFSRCQITLEFDSTVNFKFKTALKKKIVDNDGIVSFIVTKKVPMYTFVITSGFACSVSLNAEVNTSVSIIAHLFNRRPRPFLLVIKII